MRISFPLRVAVLALWVGFAGPAQAQGPTPATVERVDDAIHFSGRIDHDSAARLLRLLDDGQVTRLVITSQGGLVGAALDIAEAMHARGLDIEVPSACFSSCANYLLPAARRKTLGTPAAVGWHGNMAHVLHLQQTGQASWSDKAMDDARRLAQREAEFFSRIGVDGFVCWFAKLPPYDVPDFYSLTPADMARFGIGAVHVVSAATVEPARDDLRTVQVDWAGLDALRPQHPPTR